MSRSRRPGSRSTGQGSTRTFRRGILLSCFMLAGTAVLAKAAKLQVVEHERWVAAAEDQHRERLELPARRGAIFDRKGVPLALSHEMYQVSVAPRELRDPKAAATALARGLEIRASEVNAAVESSRSWVVLRGRFTAEQRREVGAIRGVYFEREFDRFYPQGDAGREVTGAVTRDGRALGGIEQYFDDILRGVPGYSVLRREAGGDAQPSISLPVVPPTDGASVHLTIDLDLQAIADVALRDAIRATNSSGGDLLLGDPFTGEILAAVSRRAGRTRSLTAITEPYEPGSTLKPFLAATLLAENVATLGDSVDAEGGVWQDGGRTFRDTSRHDWLTLADALQYSSNIAFVKYAKRLSPGQQYAYLRDFGLGTLTGIEYPTESSGWLRRPAEWSRLSPASLAMGYEIAVTPLQMLAAYGALANGGVLMEPYIVREIRATDGEVVRRRTPVQVRRVVPEEVARAITEVLVSVVEDGTASRASLATFAVAGKTGTSRRTSAGGGYVQGAYTSTFVGFFPARDPRIVIFVKLDEPQGEYYGGLTAAPVTRATLQGILASRTRAIDGRTLLASRASQPIGPPRSSARVPGTPDATREGTYVFLIADGLPSAAEEGAGTTAPVPDLTGLSLREAARRAHGAGFAVRVRGGGVVREMSPSPGSELKRGSMVTVTARGD
ncbi:MAG TPA: penicillin-binding transpeptidase domain-containing protein [Longimicrobiaceae bacterium]|nr:penicillin-binding transpeptidase domain-containing protein [Longimicrobiaceae bacterium]